MSVMMQLSKVHQSNSKIFHISIFVAQICDIFISGIMEGWMMWSPEIRLVQEPLV